MRTIRPLDEEDDPLMVRFHARPVAWLPLEKTVPMYDDLRIRLKARLRRETGLRKVIVARMLPRPWIEVLRRTGGFALILKYQLYPWTHRELARRVAGETGLPVDWPRALAEGTMARFLASADVTP